jgi:16S rRNA processing protein RimM
LILEDERIFTPGRQVILAGKAGERHTEIEFFRRQHGRCILKLRGVDEISAAQHWIGAEIRIPASELSPPKEGWFYTFQLKGCRVFTTSGEYLGEVGDLLDWGGAQVLKVRRGEEELLIPFAAEYMAKIDVDQHRIEVALPEDLRELNN